MFFCEISSTYTIDLQLPGEVRWAEVIKAERSVAKRLIKEAGQNIDIIPNSLQKITQHIYTSLGGRYLGEMQAWSKALGTSPEKFLMLQCAYELDHVQTLAADSVFGTVYKSAQQVVSKLLKHPGCTAGIFRSPGMGMVHLRSLDWPLEKGGPATRMLKFKMGKREFVTVGMVGMVGVLSGMVPGAYSASINWAMPDSLPSFDSLGPLFLLREVLETCDTFNEAVYALKNTSISTSVFYTVCGANPGEGCTIERSKKRSSVRKYGKSPLVHGNHYINRPFRKLNERISAPESDEHYALLEDSTDRVGTMSESICELGKVKSLSGFSAVLKKAPVRNDNTIHQIAFRPKTGELCVWAWR